MHALQHAQVALHFTALGRALVAKSILPTNDSAHAYWLAQRFRCDLWHRTISDHRSRIERCGTSRRLEAWYQIQPVLEEILATEPLVRVVAYSARLLEASGNDSDWGALAHSALVNQLEARQRCLNLIVFGHGLPVEQAVKLNRIRRLLELVTDQMLGLMPQLADLSHYGFDEVQIKSLQSRIATCSVRSRFPLFYRQMLSAHISLRLRAELDTRTAHAELNRELLSAAMGMFPSVSFDSLGLPIGPMHREGLEPTQDSDVNLTDLSRPISAPFHLLHQAVREPTPSSKRYGRQ